VAPNDDLLPLALEAFADLGYEGASMRYAGPDPAALARAFGVRAWTATDEAGFRAAFIAALAAPGPTLIDARVDPSGYRQMLEIVRGKPRA